MIPFENWLAQYRALVKETLYSLENNARSQSTSIEELTRPGSSTIIVIEDKADEWFLIQRTLTKKFPNAVLHFLPDATQALAYLDASVCVEQGPPGMILLDLYLPNAEAGFRLLKAIKNNHRFAAVPVITLSRSSHINDITKVFRCGGNAYLVKPDDYLDWPEAFTILDHY